VAADVVSGDTVLRTGISRAILEVVVDEAGSVAPQAARRHRLSAVGVVRVALARKGTFNRVLPMVGGDLVEVAVGVVRVDLAPRATSSKVPALVRRVIISRVPPMVGRDSVEAAADGAALRP
jgi:hypothetical protein